MGVCQPPFSKSARHFSYLPPTLLPDAIHSFRSDGYATSLSWTGDRYLAIQLVPRGRARGAGGVRLLDTRSSAETVLHASRLIVSYERSPGEGTTGIFRHYCCLSGS